MTFRSTPTRVAVDNFPRVKRTLTFVKNKLQTIQSDISKYTSRRIGPSSLSYTGSMDSDDATQHRRSDFRKTRASSLRQINWIWFLVVEVLEESHKWVLFELLKKQGFQLILLAGLVLALSMLDCMLKMRILYLFMDVPRNLLGEWQVYGDWQLI